jgi:hypothetical protein
MLKYGGAVGSLVGARLLLLLLLVVPQATPAETCIQ